MAKKPVTEPEATPAETDASTDASGPALIVDPPAMTQGGADPQMARASDAGPETAPEAAPETGRQGTGADPFVATAPPPSRRRGGLVGPLLGGVMAAALGFGTAIYLLPQLPDGWRPVAADPALAETVAAQSARIEKMAQDIAALRTAPTAEAVDMATLQAQVGQLRDEVLGQIPPAPDLGGLQKTLVALDSRLRALETRPVEGGGASAAAVETALREVEALRGMISAQQDQAARHEAALASAATEAEARVKAAADQALQAATDARAVARNGMTRAALGTLLAALDTGAPYGGALNDLSAAGLSLPPALSGAADRGIPTLAGLRASFPEAARAALAATATAPENSGALERIGTFLRGQTGARSLTPQHGASPDAILSRAEAALAAGDLGASLDEIAALPEAGRQAMSGWLEEAQRRRDAVEAARALAAGQQ